MDQTVLKLDKETAVNLSSLLTYCKINHPSKFLRHTAKKLLRELCYENLSLFNDYEPAELKDRKDRDLNVGGPENPVGVSTEKVQQLIPEAL